jgi:LysM repeat protein
MDNQDKPLGSSPATGSQTPSSVPPGSTSSSTQNTPFTPDPPSSPAPSSSSMPPSMTTSGIPQPHNPSTDSGMVPPPKHGTNPLLIVGIIFLIVAVLGGAVFFAVMQNQKAPAAPQTPAAPTVILSPTMEVTPTTTEPSVSSQSGTTNSQLNQDAQTIDKNVTQAQQDNSNVDQNLNEQPTNLNQ